jgi:hypothetical protein
MTAKAGKLERQRQRIRELIEADPSRSATSIAVEIGCSTHTVVRQRKLHMQMHTADCTVNGTAGTAHAGSSNLLPPAEHGNGRAVSHGAHSEVRIAPRRARILDELRQRFTGVDDDLLLVQAHRRAQLELLSDHLDVHGVVRGGKRGEVTPAAAFAERLASSYERQHERLVALQREAEKVDPQAALDAYVTGLSDAPGDDEEVDDDDA